MQDLILGSNSPFRAALLGKLNLPFTTASPDIDESPKQGESAQALVERLARAKAKKIAVQNPHALIIGSDQVAVIDKEIIGKPGNHLAAVQQLKRASGKTVRFLTGLALYNAKDDTMQSLVEPFDVTFRALSDDDIESYLLAEQPYQCAGSFKSEGLGICLFEKLNGEDPNALIGLPLIQLTRLLNNVGINVLSSQTQDKHTPHPDSRLAEIKLWVSDFLKSEDFNIVPASSDASFRRYFRVSTQNASWIVMDAPPNKEDIGPFIKIGQFLGLQQIHVPEILAQETQSGFLLLSDLGDMPYLDVLTDSTADDLYTDAIDSLVNIQSCDTDAITLPHYDRSLLQRELDLFPDWFLSRHLDISPPHCLQASFDFLINNALSQPQVIVHRDYHSRNLMAMSDRNPGIIDFQDAVIGPISYDLVSLLRDCYIAWPQQKIDDWLLHYYKLAQQRDLLTNCDLATFTRWFDLMGLQRHLKVLGIFCRLNYRDNKPNYMDDLPQTLSYVMQVCQRYEDLHEFTEFLSSHDKIVAISK